MSLEMQHSSSSNSVNDFQQLWGHWTTLLNRFFNDPKVAQLMNTRIGQYLSSHPFLALTMLVFGTMSALPVGLFLFFALLTIIMSAVGFVFFEGFLLFVGGLTLLIALSGIALFSVMVSIIFNVVYIIMSNVIIRYYPHLTKGGKVQEVESEYETSKLKEMQ